MPESKIIQIALLDNNNGKVIVFALDENGNLYLRQFKDEKHFWEMHIKNDTERK